MFHLIREEGPFLLQHPYESFNSSVERFLKEASTDPKVLVIKMTLYRAGGDSPIGRPAVDPRGVSLRSERAVGESPGRRRRPWQRRPWQGPMTGRSGRSTR